MTSISTDFRYRFLSINYANISQLHFDTVGIAKLLSNLDVKKAEDLAKNLDHGKQSDIILLDFLKLLILSHINASYSR